MINLLVAFFVGAVAVVIALHKYLTWHYRCFKRLGLPGPQPRLIYGNTPSAVTLRRNLAYDYEDIYSQYKNSQQAVGMFVGRHPEILLLDPKLAHEVLVSKFGKFRDNGAALWLTNLKRNRYVSRNPFFSMGDNWKQRRADVIVPLSWNKLSLAYPIWKNSATKLQTFLNAQVSQSSAVLESKDLAFRFTVDIMCDFLWGLESSTFAVNAASKPNAVMRMAEQMVKNFLNVLMRGLQFSSLPGLELILNRPLYPESTDKFFLQLTQEALTMRAQQGSENAKRSDFLSHILQLQEKKLQSTDDMMGHFLTVILDLYHTSAVVIFHTLFYLAKYPDVQEKLRAEILEGFNEDSSKQFDELINLPYLDQCIHETIRIIPPIMAISRLCTEATDLELDNGKLLKIAQGTTVTVPVYSYHRDPEYFPRPEEYNPDRFANAAHNDKTKAGIFLPFGDGPRICAGMRLGMLSVKTFLVQLLKEYRIQCCSQTMEDKKPDGLGFILALDGPILLEYERIAMRPNQTNSSNTL